MKDFHETKFWAEWPPNLYQIKCNIYAHIIANLKIETIEYVNVLEVFEKKVLTRPLIQEWKILNIVQNVCGFITSFQIVWNHHAETITSIPYKMEDAIGIQKLSL